MTFIGCVSCCLSKLSKHSHRQKGVSLCKRWSENQLEGKGLYTTCLGSVWQPLCFCVFVYSTVLLYSFGNWKLCGILRVDLILAFVEYVRLSCIQYKLHKILGLSRTRNVPKCVQYVGWCVGWPGGNALATILKLSSLHNAAHVAHTIDRQTEKYCLPV